MESVFPLAVSDSPGIFPSHDRTLGTSYVYARHGTVLMKLYNRVIIPFLLAALVMIGCDASENPNLLNPPPPDSTRVRVVNLLPDGEIDVAVPGIPLAVGIGPIQVSPLNHLLVLQQTVVVVRRTSPAVRFDTAYSQILAQGATVTYAILGGNDTNASRILSFGTGEQEKSDLRTAGEARLGFLNAVNDTSGYFIKVGSPSGPILFNTMAFAEMPRSITTGSRDLSLYLFSTRDSFPITSARLDMSVGTVSHLIAATVGGQVRLLLLEENTAATVLPEAPPETRTTATVELLNAISDEPAVSARLNGATSDFARNVPQLSISPATEIEAWINLSGDSLLVSTQDNKSYTSPVSLAVGSRTLMVVFKGEDGVQTLALSRDIPESANGKVHIRGVNASTFAGGISISVGAGAPAPINADYRPFGTLLPGGASGFVEIPPGAYPFMVSSARTGKFFGGGVEQLDPGYYTLFAVDDAGTPTLRILREDTPAASLDFLESGGSRVTFFNVMPDAEATFTAGPLTLAALPYSYVYSTLAPYSVRTIGSNVGTIAVDLTLGSYTIGTTGAQGARHIIAFRSPTDTLPPKVASIRFLNAVPDSPELVLRIGSNRADSIAILPFGTPTPALALDARKYSFFVTQSKDSTARARADGVELLAGRHYLLVVAPKRTGSTSPTSYEAFFIQE